MPKHSNSDVVVLGAGVSGLTTALCLAEEGRTVRVVADRPPPQTTSVVAGAIWGPYVVDDDRAFDWSMRTLSQLRELAHSSSTGVRLVSGVEAAPGVASPPAWVAQMDGFALVDPSELPPGFGSGWRYRVPVIEMSTYLGYLSKCLADRGVTIELIDSVGGVDELRHWGPTIVNCAGLGARELVPDDSIHGVRGQLVVVDNPGVSEFFSDYPESSTPTYILPQGDHVVLGGTIGADVADLEPDPVVAEEIRARCAKVVPAVADARLREHRVGLRPARPRVRLEAVEQDGVTVVHNYGHGGSGVTLSWGCAEEVRRLLRREPYDRGS